MIIKKISLTKECFPKTWLRKLPLLFFQSDIIIKNNELAGLCITFNKRIILICVAKKLRREGLSSTLIQRSNATKAETYFYNKIALKMWQKNGFKIKEIKNGLFGKKYILKREL